jgi:hypothetical protein
MLHTTGELFLSPIGLSMVTKLSPKKMAGTAMGAWFLSFAIANLLGGQIAALTGSGHGGGEDIDKSVFGTYTTVQEAFEMNGTNESFDKWEDFYSAPEALKVKPKDKKDIEIAKNITYSKWLQIKDWVELRESLESNESSKNWFDKRMSQDTFKTADDWLDQNTYNSVRSKYKKYAEADYKNGENAGLSLGDWMYFRGGMDEIVSNDLSLKDAIDKQRDIVQKSRLDKYVDIFTKIGIVLLVISLLIALISKPLKKLMHGVE